jgi:hypothetical protein
MKRIAAAVVLLVMVALVTVLSGCVSSPTGESLPLPNSGTGSWVEEDYSYAGPAVATGQSVVYYGDEVSATAVQDGADQMVIRTSSVELEVREVTPALDSLKAIALAHGGYVGSLSVHTLGDTRLYGVLTMRVPATSFDTTLEEVKSLGTLKSQNLQADDVTEEYVDLQARRSALADQLAQYRKIMESAQNVSEVLEVQEQIERVQVEIDRIDGRLKYLDNRVDYATITVTVREPEPVGSTPGFSITSVLNDGISGFLAVIAVLIIVIISILPLIVIGVFAFLVYRWWRGKKSGRAGTETKGNEKTGGEKKPPSE